MHPPAFVIVLLLLFSSTHLRAQSAPAAKGITVFGSFGWDMFSRMEDSGQFGSGLSAGGGVGLGLSSRARLAVEVRAVRVMKERTHSPITFSAGLVHELSGTRRARPYILGGIGMLRSHYRTTDVVRHTVTDVADLGWGAILGAGVRIPIAPAWSLRPELTYITAPWGSRQNLAETRPSIAVSYSR